MARLIEPNQDKPNRIEIIWLTQNDWYTHFTTWFSFHTWYNLVLSSHKEETSREMLGPKASEEAGDLRLCPVQCFISGSVFSWKCYRSTAAVITALIEHKTLWEMSFWDQILSPVFVSKLIVYLSCIKRLHLPLPFVLSETTCFFSSDKQSFITLVCFTWT